MKNYLERKGQCTSLHSLRCLAEKAQTVILIFTEKRGVWWGKSIEGDPKPIIKCK